MAQEPVNKKSVGLSYVPRKWQQFCHNRFKRFNVLVVPRRSGKSELAMMELIDRAAQCKLPLPLYAYVAPELKQAKQNLWDRLKLKLQPLTDAGGVDINESETWVKLKGNGAKIRLFGANEPDSLRGIHLDGVVVDEVAQVPPMVWDEVLRPMLADRNGWAIFIGTPKGVNLFSKLYYDALKQPDVWFAKKWTVWDVDALPVEEVKAIEATTNPVVFAREYLCDFEAQGEDQLIPLSLAVAASRRGYNPNDRVITGSPVILGVDPARFGSDRSVIVRRQGLCCFDPLAYSGIDNMELADIVAREINRWHPAVVFIDAGAGAGVIDRLKQLNHRVVEVPFGGKATTAGFSNRRAEMWWKMRKWLEAGGAIPTNDVLVRELSTPTFWYDTKDQVVLEPKDSIRERLPSYGSPDIADALCLTFAADVPPDLDLFAERSRPDKPRGGRYHPFARGNGRR